MLKFALPVAALLFAAALPAVAHEYKAGDLTIEHPMIPAPAENAKVAGGFMKITNSGTTEDKLLSASSDIGMTQVHKSAVDANGMATMTEQKEVPLPAGQTVAFEHGGLHIMFMDITAPMKVGDMVPVTLVFEKAGPVKVEFKVEERKDAMEKMDHSSHGTTTTNP